VPAYRILVKLWSGASSRRCPRIRYSPLDHQGGGVQGGILVRSRNRHLLGSGLTTGALPVACPPTATQEGTIVVQRSADLTA